MGKYAAQCNGNLQHGFGHVGGGMPRAPLDHAARLWHDAEQRQTRRFLSAFAHANNGSTMSMLKKALERGLTPSNVISYLCLQIMRVNGALWGTLRLRLKALALGVRVESCVSAHGPVGLMRWPGSTIRIGTGASLISSWRRATAAALYAPVRLRTFGPGASIEIGPGCQLSGTSVTARSTVIRLGRQVMFGPNCVVVDSDFHAHWPPEARATEPGMEGDRPVSVGDYAWIGMNCLILKGVTIGEGAIIGAGSVVTRDVPPFCLAAGSPARVLRCLKPGETPPADAH